MNSDNRIWEKLDEFTVKIAKVETNVDWLKKGYWLILIPTVLTLGGVGLQLIR